MQTAARAAAILLAFSVQISTALDGVLTGLLLVFGLLGFGPEAWRILWTHPAARATGLLFGMLAFAQLYSPAPWREAVGTLGKYADLALIPVFFAVFRQPVLREAAQKIFLWASGLVLILSLALWLGWLPHKSWMWAGATSANPAVFRSYLTQGVFLSFATFIALLRLREPVVLHVRISLSVLAAAAMFNILFLLQGRTGFAMLFILLGWFGWSTLVRSMAQRGKLIGAVWLLVLAAFSIGVVAALYQFSPRMHERIQAVESEWRSWEPGKASPTSTGQRLEFYSHTLQIVRAHPWFGVGTGGFVAAYAELVRGTEIPVAHHPHNEYLLIAAQTGMVGLALLLWMFYRLWKIAPELPTPLEQDAVRGLVLATMVNCLFNSALHDHADGLFFALMVGVFCAGWRPPQGARA
ncbi:MAG: O-antigen ligase family protein [Pseudomonadota bacterium]